MNFTSCSQNDGKPASVGLRLQRQRGKNQAEKGCPGWGGPGHSFQMMDQALALKSAWFLVLQTQWSAARDVPNIKREFEIMRRITKKLDHATCRDNICAVRMKVSAFDWVFQQFCSGSLRSELQLFSCPSG